MLISRALINIYKNRAKTAVKRKILVFIKAKCVLHHTMGEFELATISKARIFDSFQFLRCTSQGIEPMRMKQGQTYSNRTCFIEKFL